MIYGENQVRNFHVVEATISGDTVSANPFKAQGDVIVGKDAQGMPIDKIKKDCIRRIDVVTPKTYKLKEYHVELKTAIATEDVGKDYMLYLDFENLYGFGQNDRYHKFAVVHITSEMVGSATKFYEALYDNLVMNFKHEKYSPVEFVLTGGVGSATKVVIKEKDYTVTNHDLLIQNLPIPLELTVTATDNEGKVWAKYNTAGTYIAVTEGTNKGNAWIIADMERFFMKSRADKYGYVGFPNVTPSTPALPSTFSESNNTYSLIEIQYYHQGHGMLNQNSEKQLTLIVKNGSTYGAKADAEALAKELSELLFN